MNIDYEELLDELLMAIDYDTYKNYQPSLAEEPEFVDDDRAYLISIIKSYVK